MRKILIFISLCPVFVTACSTQGHLYISEADLTEIETLLTGYINEFELPSLQVGYKQPGEKIQLAARGTFDLKHTREPVQISHSYRVGSSSKMFTAVLFLRMAEEKKLTLDQTIDHWFPQFEGASTITVKELLSHTSGIDETLFTRPGLLIQSGLNKNKDWNPEVVMNKLWDSSLSENFESREFRYSNNNYVLLGIIAEKEYGIPLGEILNQEFFIPLGMSQTVFIPGSDHSKTNIVPGYDEYIPFGPHLIDQSDISWDSLSFAAAGTASSSRDLILWMDALFHGELLSEDSMNQMMTWTDSKNNGRDDNMIAYGLGISQYELGGKRLIGHPGGGFGGECFPFWSPDTDTFYVLMYNLSRKDNPAGKKLLLDLISLAERK